MERKGWTITTASVVAILGALALNGGKLVEVATGAWLFLLKLSATAPLGLSSFLLALALGVASRPFLLHYLPPMPCKASRDFVIDASALVIGCGVMFGQLRTLNGLLLGLLAGFAAPLLAKGLGALLGMTRRTP
jgi:hypothetical protein